MKRVIFLAFLTLLCATACNKNRYIANVTDLQLVSVSPREGYEGSLVKVLGRNFSTSFGENEVTINGVKAKLIDFSKDQITIIAPENEYGTYPVVVSTPKGTISHENVTFTYKKRPDKLYMVTTVAGNGANALKDDIGASASVGGVEGLCFAPDGTLWFCQRNEGMPYAHSTRPRIWSKPLHLAQNSHGEEGLTARATSTMPEKPTIRFSNCQATPSASIQVLLFWIIPCMSDSTLRTICG